MISKNNAKNNYSRLIDIWESAVVETHNFLSQKDFMYVKSKMHTYLDNVIIYLYKDISGDIGGFMGVSDDKIEMLFVENKLRGKGIGKNLLMYAVYDLKIYKVDVNEQNILALNFYTNFGFENIGYSKFDSDGKNYPIIHLHFLSNTK